MIFKGEIFLNFWLSALIYNPLEAFILIYFCSIFAEIKIDKNIIKHCYILGFINLLIQYCAKIINNDIYALIYNIFITLFLSEIILYVFINKFLMNKIKFKICVYSSIFNFITLYISIILINNIKVITLFNTVRSIEHEFFVNFFIKVFQIFFLFILKSGVISMKNLLKNIAFKNTEKAFTFMEYYTPKMPKVLKEKLEKNK